ncbi:esterase YqiA [Simiduia sp. 21SJ11W-1]|uniref:YqiA/YcfP family alpha/beta fold hydrolase n=1 Tax=Simiduia sp. 21SJ11W-1 TaxID=2909669 RepID=UPI0020A201BC|nr:YqiA/YcfP family alpha/beta fold hydrolase [Simiduia sp. 21SJ11W-1]UTA48186.1 esterase YqiA [Simiduia sp. 21SJ11W-1]
MPRLLYIHGFLSSPASAKAVQVRDWLAVQHPEVEFICPALSPHPQATAEALEAIAGARDEPLGVMGSSLGGFWATWLVERFGVRAALINPSTNPMALLPAYIDKPVKNYHTDATYTLTGQDLADLAQYNRPVIERPANYWLLVQTGDETLDYRLAVKKYHACRQTVELGGDHSFQNFERFIAPAVDFVLPGLES